MFPGLLSLDGGRTLNNVIEAFEQAGYHVTFRILNAAHYGVPEERWRLFFIGTRLPNVDLHSLCLCTTVFSDQTLQVSWNTFGFVPNPLQTHMAYDALLPPIRVGEAISDLPPIESGGGSAEMDYMLVPQSKYQVEARKWSPKLYNHECAGASIDLERMRYVQPGGSWRDIPHDILPRVCNAPTAAIIQNAMAASTPMVL